MSDPVRGVVVAHGRLADAFVQAVEGISGVTDALHPVSNEGLGPERLREVIAEASGPGEAILFVDLAGGSCALASVRQAKASGRTACVTGVNVPMLLDFVFHRDLPLDALVQRLIDKGQAGQRAHWGAPTPTA